MSRSTTETWRNLFSAVLLLSILFARQAAAGGPGAGGELARPGTGVPAGQAQPPQVTLYVNNRAGDDTNDGKTEKTAFATIARAVKASKTSGRIILANTGIPYREPIDMENLGGTPARPFIIEGSNAAISGCRAVRAEEWQKVGDGLYYFATPVPSRETAYFMNRGKKIPRLSKKTLPEELGPDEYVYEDKKGFYFRCTAGKKIEDYDLSLTLIRNGFAAFNSSYIVCRDLATEYFANDGFSIHGDCRGIYLENIEARYCGDQGVSAHEVCGLVVRNAYLHHNGYGVVDVNGSRSVYNGVLAEHNGNGAGFCGGFHSIEDCVIRDNERTQVFLDYNPPQHLVGSEHNPICPTMLFMKNAVIHGNGTRAGVQVGKGAKAILEHLIILRSKPGIQVEEGAVCHLTASVVADCECTLDSASGEFFRDFNFYDSRPIRWMGKQHLPENWDEFRKAAGHDGSSAIGKVAPKVGEDGNVSFDPWPVLGKGKKKPGPTQPIAVWRGEKP